MSTKLLYLQDMSILSCKSRVTSIDPAAKTVILDQSPFYPQGGGQSSDKGTLKDVIFLSVYEVTAVKKDPSSGQVLHFLSSVEGLQCDSEVSCEVDPITRDLNSRSHSAGHLLDHAVEDLKLPLEVRGAYHFLPCPYVEYAFVDPSIDLSSEFLKSLQESLETAANKIVEEAMPVRVYSGNVADLSDWRQNLLPVAVKQSGIVRLVKFERDGLDPVPCSGTHVNNSFLIKKIKIKKISLNKNIFRFRDKRGPVMFYAEDYWKLKKAYAALKRDDLTAAFNLFLSCKRTLKISFNLAVISIWKQKDLSAIVRFLLDAIGRDPYLSIAAFYLGVLTRRVEYFESSLKGFRDCCEFIDYTAIGMPFLLTREDVLFNMVSLQPPTADPSALQKLSIQSISSLLLSQLADSSNFKLRTPPFEDRKMIFYLLPSIEPEAFELKGPEHVVLIEGEEDYFSGFPDAHNRQIKLNLLKKEETESFN